MRTFFTTEGARLRGITSDELRWGVHTGRWRRIERGLYADGPDDPSPLDRAMAAVVVTGGVASGHLAAVLHGLDGVDLRGPDVTLGRRRNGRRNGVRRRHLDPQRIVLVAGVRCTDGLQTLLDVAATVDDCVWEQALESALRKRLVTVGQLETFPPRTPGGDRIRRVLSLRPPEAPPTESLLETLMVQLARTVEGLGPPVRQYEVINMTGQLIARVDLAWPELGLFIELDGAHHAGQRLHDARRETAVVAATGWLCARFTWREVATVPRSTAKRLAALAAQARRRPFSPEAVSSRWA